jgi:tripartite-type tricarboxylate transporter receptor subunit TctC
VRHGTIRRSHKRDFFDRVTPERIPQGLAGFELGIWYGLFLPKNAPAAIINKLHDSAIVALETPALRERFNEIGVQVVAPERRSPDYLARFVASEIEKWAAPIKASGISVE